MQNRFLLLLLAVLTVPAWIGCKKGGSHVAARSFYMGVTPWPADFTPAELDTAYSFVNTSCDIVSHHFDDGIPYQEAYADSVMPAALVEDVQTRKTKTAPGKVALLSVAALDHSRVHMAGYYSKASVDTALRRYWETLPADDPSVVTAYVHYVSYLIEQLHPSYVNYGVESNSLIWDSVQFRHYKAFLTAAYEDLRNKYPGLPFFVSFMVDESEAGLNNARSLLAITDIIGLSAYPYVTVSSSAGGNTDPSLFPPNYFERFIQLDPSRPFAFAETGYAARDVVIPSLQLAKHGTPAWQDAYLQKALQLCDKYHAKFLIWFCSKDYAAGDATLRSLGLYQDFFGIWQDTGLKDSLGVQRPSFNTWTAWIHRTLAPN